ncbi:MAG: NAD(P)/FAD-dependent oxidoreductase [Crocinitomicaceae bacterium]|nr:NAD(P)/FAD-dependent oxidoreductase [Crocinitomicaceae bacterium]
MANTKHQIVIVGAGSGGIMVAANALRKRKNLDIAIIDPADFHYYQPAWTLVSADVYDYEKTKRPMEKYIPKGAKWIKDKVAELDPDNNQVKLASGDTVSYDYLVMSPGLQNRPDLVEGLAETLGKNNVCSVYTDPLYAKEVLMNFKSGNGLFTFPDTPLKCPGAPQKVAYLVSDRLNKKSILNHGAKVIYAFPGGICFGVEPFKTRLYEINEERGIVLKHAYSLVKIDGPNKKAYYKQTKTENADGGPITMNDPNNEIKETETEDGLKVIDCEVCHLAPPQRAFEWVQKSKLAHQDGPDKGWMKVDQFTMQNPDYSNVFGVGDTIAVPTARTGAAIRKQAPVVVDNILALIDGKPITSHHYNGYSSCPLVTGKGRMLLAEFGYGGKRMSDPLLSKFVDTSREKWTMWLLKKYGLPFIYWNKMLKGKMMD